jgi:dTDP-glucose pyrophosphorylase
MDESSFIGLLSIGDLQRAIIKNLSVHEKIQSLLRIDQLYVDESSSFESIKSIMIEHRMEFCPVIDANKKIKQIYFWEDLFPNRDILISKPLGLPLVVMAGGMGTRLYPLTKVLPKPLLPIGDKSILEEIIDRFKKFDCCELHLSLNYKSELVQKYLESSCLDINVNYYVEDMPLGTAGALSLMKDSIHGPFFVTNCDILIDEDYSVIFDYHRSNKNDMTIVSAIKNMPISYGTLETNSDGILIGMSEKPEFTFQINTGMYIMESHIFQFIPIGSYYQMNQLIEELIRRHCKVGVFPVSPNSWKDIGEMHLFTGLINKRNMPIDGIT